MLTLVLTISFLIKCCPHTRSVFHVVTGALLGRGHAVKLQVLHLRLWSCWMFIHATTDCGFSLSLVRIKQKYETQ